MWSGLSRFCNLTFDLGSGKTSFDFIPTLFTKTLNLQCVYSPSFNLGQQWEQHAAIDQYMYVVARIQKHIHYTTFWSIAAVPLVVPN